MSDLNRDEIEHCPFKQCPYCPKQLKGWHFLAHMRWTHPVPYQNYMGSKIDFGQSECLHVRTVSTDGLARP